MQETQQHSSHDTHANQGPLAAEDWVAVAFALFVVLFVAKVLPKINTMLDDRSAKIAADLKQAEQLRVEAQALLADAKKKAADAEKATAEMIATAKAEAKRIAEKAEADMNEEAERKLAIVEKKIQRAEQQAIENVKKEAVEQASKVATKLLAVKTSKNQKALIDKSLEKISANIG